jgi:hypothetical protein
MEKSFIIGTPMLDSNGVCTYYFMENGKTSLSKMRAKRYNTEAQAQRALSVFAESGNAYTIEAIYTK